MGFWRMRAKMGTAAAKPGRNALNLSGVIAYVIMATFQELINSDRPVLVDFTATWCGPCKVQGPILDDLKKSVGEKAGILKIDIDKNPSAARHYNVQGVPTLILFKNGQIKWRQSGVTPLLQLKAEVEKWM